MIVQHNMQSMIANRQLGIERKKFKAATEKLSSGYRINRSADDTAGLQISEKMRSQIRGLGQASNNMEDANSLIQVADGAMAEIQSILHRINELCVQAANDTNQDSDREVIQEEIDQLIDGVSDITENTLFNGIKVLCGNTPAGAPIYGVRGNMPTTVISSPNTTTLGHLTDTFNNVVPGYTNTIQSITDSAGVVHNIGGSNVVVNGQTYTIGSPYSSFSTTPVVSGTGTTGAVNNGNINVTDTTTGGSVIFNVNEQYNPKTNNHSTAYMDYSVLATPADVSTLVGKGFHSTCCTCENRYSIEFVNSGGHSVTPVGQNYIYKVDISGAANGNDVVDAIVAAMGGASSNWQDASGNTITGKAPQNHYSIYAPEVDVAGNRTGRLMIFDERPGQLPGGNRGLYNQGVYDITGYMSQPVPEFLNIQTGPNAWDAVQLYLPNTKLNTLNLAGTIDVSSHPTASGSITIVQNALQNVSSQRGYIGAMQNRFEAGIANADNMAENTQAAESRVRDTDMAKEMVGYAKSNILMQATQSMLAQANNVTQGVVQLLQ